jgi:hypothetical protein
MTDLRRLRVPALLITALAALLVFAGAASAETRTGESTSATDQGTTSPEATLVRSSASYESTGGIVSFEITTAAEPQAGKEGKHSETGLDAALFTGTSGCSLAALEGGGFSPPVLEILSRYEEPTFAGAGLFTTLGGGPSEILPAGKTVTGTTTTLATTSPEVANKGFNCAIVETQEEEGSSLMTFPVAAPVIPPGPAPSPVPAPTPVPAPPALSIAKAKPLSLKVGSRGRSR